MASTPAEAAFRPARRESQIRSEDVRLRLMIVAEQLFAEGGFNGVSLREIAARAGQKNNNAVQYHFGTRERLIDAIFESRMLQMEATRAAMLARAEAESRLENVRALVEIVYLPQLQLRKEGGRHTYAGFLSHYLLRTHGTRFGEFAAETQPHLSRVLELLRALIPHLPDDVAQRRLVGCSLMFVKLLMQHDDAGWADAERTGESFEAAVDDTLDQIALCLTAPLQAPKVSSMC
jgi:AcrR family transcriptional regulator